MPAMMATMTSASGKPVSPICCDQDSPARIMMSLLSSRQDRKPRRRGIRTPTAPCRQPLSPLPAPGRSSRGSSRLPGARSLPSPECRPAALAAHRDFQDERPAGQYPDGFSLAGVDELAVTAPGALPAAAEPDLYSQSFSHSLSAHSVQAERPPRW